MDETDGRTAVKGVLLTKKMLCGFFERQNILRVVILHHHTFRNREWTTKMKCVS
jgi:hypothetical protein